MITLSLTFARDKPEPTTPLTLTRYGTDGGCIDIPPGSSRRNIRGW